jgi:large subunit ribosomal protein L29
MPRENPFKDLTVDELKSRSHDLAKEIFELKNEFKATRKIEKPHLVKEKKKDRARVLTHLNQKLGAATHGK